MEAEFHREMKYRLHAHLIDIQELLERVSGDESFHGHICKWFEDLAMHWERLATMRKMMVSLSIVRYDVEFQTIFVHAGGVEHALVAHKLACWPNPKDAAMRWFPVDHAAQRMTLQ